MVTHEINGRDGSLEIPIFRITTPDHWIRLDPDKNDDLKDTTKPLVTFQIKKKEERITITIHSFPFFEEHLRVPQSAQIKRWRNQFSVLDSSSIILENYSSGGFVGFLLEASGRMNEKETSIIAFAMQLAQEHISSVKFQMQLHPEKRHYFHQMCCDYTFKALGSKEMMRDNRMDILSSASTLEFIEDIPR